MVSPVNSQPIPPDIVRLTGPLFLGNILNWALFGALSVQVYLYYLAFPKDRPLPKILVTVAFILELTQTVLSTRDGFIYFGFSWGNVEALNEVGMFWFSIPIITGVVSCIVQLFFAWRIWIISSQKHIPILIGMLSFCQAAAGVWTGVQSKILQFWSDVQMKNGTPPSIWLGTAATCDVFITLSMFYYLSTSRTGFRTTNAILVKFIRLTVETGLLTSTLTVIDLALFLAIKNTNYYLTLSIMLSKLYSNSLLVILNARIHILNGREVGQATIDSSLSWMSATSAHTTPTTPLQHRFEQVPRLGAPTPRWPSSILRLPKSRGRYDSHASPLSVAVTRVTESSLDDVMTYNQRRLSDSDGENVHVDTDTYGYGYEGNLKKGPVCNV